MPRPSKSQTNNALECSNCFKLCKSEAGLTQHYNRVHLYTGYAPNGLNPLLDNPSDTTLPDSIPPDIDREVSSNEEGSIAKWIFSNEEDYLSEESNISLYDSEVNGDTSSDEETTNSGEIDDTHILNLIQLGEDLPHHQAGYIYQTQGTGSRIFEIQENLQMKHGHPFSPWANEDDFWLSYHIIVKARMSMSTSSDLLNSFKNGRISMRGSLSYHTNKKMLELIDKAEYITVTIYYLQILYK